MMIWLNGPFGVGKTTVARLLTSRSSGRRIFDPETVGSMLHANLAEYADGDFQDLPAWRRLVPRISDEIIRLSNEDLVVVQTILVESYWNEIRTECERLGHRVVHVLLDCDAAVLRQRIADDNVVLGAKSWRMDHVKSYVDARSWLRACADVIVDATSTAPGDVVALIKSRLNDLPARQAVDLRSRER